MAYVIVVSPEFDHAYRKEDEVIMGTLLQADGSISTEYDDWWEVALEELSSEERSCIVGFFENLNHL